MTLEEKRALLVKNHEKAVSLNNRAATESRDFTKEEKIEFDSILNESEGIRMELVEDEKRAARLSQLNEYMTKPTSKPMAAGVIPTPPAGKDYRNLGEWFIESRTMSMGVPGTGGIVVPEQFKNTILSMKGESQIIRPRATVIEAGDPPDAKITIPVFNQFGANGIYGGMTMQWIGEGGTKADTTPEFTSIELEPKELGGSTIITDQLLRNAPALSSWLQTQYGMLVNGKEDYVFLRGNGVGQAQGILGCAAEKAVARNTASQVLFTDIRSMLTALPADSWGSAVWIANQTVLPYLLNLVDTAGNTLFMVGDITKKIPASLFGLPIIFTGKTPTLGTKGDLMLADLSYYLIKDGSGPYFASSEHVYFTTNKTVVKCFKLVDGAPWVKSTLLLEDGSTTVSPFVALA
jgi:HK97 family phage major capsid protein